MVAHDGAARIRIAGLPIVIAAGRDAAPEIVSATSATLRLQPGIMLPIGMGVPSIP